CGDAENNACTTAGCEAGVCVQTHVRKPCPQDQCNTGNCDATSGRCLPVIASTPCTAATPVECKVAGCEVGPTNTERGVCVATHTNAMDSTPCSDADNNACTTAGCEAGTCVQTHVQRPCPPQDACNTGTCDPTTGRCLPVIPSTPCPVANP